MPSMDDHTAAMTNRSLRTIRTELEYLTDARLISPTQLANLLSQLPSQTPLHAPLQSPTTTGAAAAITPSATGNLAGVASQLKNNLLSDKKSSTNNEKHDYYSPQPTPAPVIPSALPPPAYSHTPKSLASASALYEYMPSDAGDLALLPNDRVSITEFMNADWAKGRNERTGQEGIFPRSYVQIIDEKSAMVGMAPPQTPSGYGNVPLDVSQSGSGSVGTGAGGESKFNQHGKKFGKKMGNAAIFGAGATIGSNIVNGIF
ncbi:MAG: hypothetical protein L6R40_002051 [Gallowayella cf. fulva]|nr:MAG: hypothetical protein L6R40_002051 [Xanthomendoza cf. fulva]